MFGKRLRLLRKERAMTQSNLAELLNVSTSTIGMYERSKICPSTGLLLDISKLFDVSIDYILGCSESKTPLLNSKEILIISELRKLSSESKKEVIEYIELLKIKELSEK